LMPVPTASLRVERKAAISLELLIRMAAADRRFYLPQKC